MGEGEGEGEGGGVGERDGEREGEHEGERVGGGVGERVGGGEGEVEGEREGERVGERVGEGIMIHDDYEPVPGMDEDPQEDDYAAWLAERDLCPDCAGSGEGYTDGSRCTSCGGSGVERDDDEDERRECAREDKADARRDDRMTGVYDDD